MGSAADPGPAASPFFTTHARAYVTSARHARGADLGRLVALLGPGPGRRAVDVATGTGHAALALAEAGCAVIGVDPTPAMLAEARTLAAERGLAERLDFVLGVAEALPVPDACADIVVCRRAAHHFTDVALAVAEMARALRPGGRLGISDMCPEVEAVDAVNRLERLRDGTHAAALHEGAWQEVVAAARLRLTALEVSCEDLTLQEWLAPVSAEGPEAEAIRRELEGLDEATAAMITGGEPGRWRKRRVVLVAQRPA